MLFFTSNYNIAIVIWLGVTQSREIEHIGRHEPFITDCIKMVCEHINSTNSTSVPHMTQMDQYETDCIKVLCDYALITTNIISVTDSLNSTDIIDILNITCNGVGNSDNSSLVNIIRHI
jgi:hypothetical protein